MTPQEALAELEGHADSLAFVLDRFTVVIPHLKESITMANKRARKNPTAALTSPEALTQTAPSTVPEPAPKPASPAEPTLEDVVAWLETRDTEMLRTLSGKVLNLLKRRAATEKGETPNATKTPEQREAEKAEYKASKAAYQERPFGVQGPDGKVLKRRFLSADEAIAAAAKLTVDMKRTYQPVQLAA